MKSTYLASPCRNFCILGADVIPSDPKDGREKYAITTYVAGGTGRLIIIDTHTFTSEYHDFPGDEGAWAITYLPDYEEIIIGTCATKGYLHSFHLATRSFQKPLRLETDTYLWNFARGGDGNLYASTFPGCNLVQYNPAARTLQTVCRAGEVKENLYSRFTYANADGNILVNAGYSVIEAFCYDITKKELKPFGVPGDSIWRVTADYIFVKNEKFYKFYDPSTLQLLFDPIDSDFLAEIPEASPAYSFVAAIADPPYMNYLPGKSGSHIKELSDGRFIGIKGQDLFVLKGKEAQFIKIPAPAPATGIMTLSADKESVIWGSCEFGQTIFSYRPDTGEYQNTSAVTDAGGEVYGITHTGGKIFLTSYVGGDHLLYDPDSPWNQYDNLNPKNLGSTAPEMVRPHGKSVVGPDGNIWTGWCASYGVYGGGLSKIDTKTLTVSSKFQLIPEHAIEHIASGSSFLYAITSGEASGLSPKEDGYYLLKLDTDFHILWKKQFDKGIHFKRIVITGGYLLVSYTDNTEQISGILVWEEDTLKEMPPIILGDYKENEKEEYKITEMTGCYEKAILVFCENKALLIELPSGRKLGECEIPGITQTAVLTPDGKLYYAVMENLYRLEIE